MTTTTHPANYAVITAHRTSTTVGATARTTGGGHRFGFPLGWNPDAVTTAPHGVKYPAAVKAASPITHAISSVSRLRIGLGTFIAVQAQARSAAIAERGIAAAFDAIALVESRMHPWRAGSDLAALRACAPGAAVALHDWTWEVLTLCARLHQLSKGCFDPCLESAPGRMSDLDLTEPGRVVVRAGVHVDLGGIAKGFAVDKAIEALVAAGCEGSLVNAGGDLAVFGPDSHEFFCPRPDGAVTRVTLRDAALASSEAAGAALPPEHRGYYHGADRRMRVAGMVSVVACSAAVADGLTKCLLSGDFASHHDLLRACGARRVV